jgi:hypothetical protein
MAPKPGIKTTEFWTHLLLQIVLLLNTVGVWDYMPQKYTVLVQGILGAAYAFSRGLAKISPPGAASTTAIYPIEPPSDVTEAPTAPK